MAIKEVLDILKEIEAIHSKKNKDYAGNDNAFENFERSAEIASWFNDPVYKVFAMMIGTKLARLATLLNKGGTPNNESIEDSFTDQATYSILWAAYYRIEHKRDEKLIAAIDNQYVPSQEAKNSLPRMNLGDACKVYQCKNCGVQFYHTPQVSKTIGLDSYFCSDKCRIKYEHPLSGYATT